MRALLDRLYTAAGHAAAFFMAATLLMVVAGIADRALALGWRGTDMYAGYAMAACGFLALAHTFKRGEHIRVSLLLQAASPRMQRAMEIWSLLAASLLAAAFSFYAIKLAWQSWEFHDVSTGNDATPLWIPQVSMAVGAVVLLVALLDDLLLELRGKRVVRASAEQLRNE
jgi:TRAP-type C4-dicarboxylate transport system permease small subunit